MVTITRDRIATTASSRAPVRLILSALILGVFALRVVRSLASGQAVISDFGAFWMAGRAALLGVNPFAVNPAILPGMNAAAPNLNPPAALLLFAPLALLPFPLAATLWYALSVTCLGATLLLCLRLRVPRAPLLAGAVLLVFDPLWQTLMFGQIYAMLAVAVALTLLLLRRESAWAGVPLGVLVAFKPNLAVWVLALLVIGNGAVVLVSVATTGVLSLSALVLFGPATLPEWLAATRSFGQYDSVSNGSLIGAFGPVTGAALGAICIVVLLVVARRFRPDGLALSAAALAVSLLASPITWAGYALLLVPAVWLRGLSPTRVIGLGILALPMMALGFVLGIPLAMAVMRVAYPLGYGLVAASFAVDLIRSSPRRRALSPSP